jgi:hypothetical protein
MVAPGRTPLLFSFCSQYIFEAIRVSQEALMSRKPWVKFLNGEHAVYAGRMPGGLLRVRVGNTRFVVITAADWAALPLA